MICEKCHAWRSSGPCPWCGQRGEIAGALLLLIAGLLYATVTITDLKTGQSATEKVVNELVNVIEDIDPNAPWCGELRPDAQEKP